MDNDYFYEYVMECIDLQGNNEELFSVQHLLISVDKQY